MKIVICWSNITSYWAACWRRLANRPGVELFVLAFAPKGCTSSHSNLLHGIAHRLLSEEERKNKQFVVDLVSEQKPDAIQVVGWFVPAYRAVVTNKRLGSAAKLMSVDTQWKRESQYLTRLRYRSYLSALSGAGVSGERSWQYVRRLGLPRKRIFRCMYGVDECVWNQVNDRRLKQTHQQPGQFLFVGRYIPEKAMEVLAEAYMRYRSQVPEPWSLVCCGSGAEGRFIQQKPGILDRGFVTPEELAEVSLESSVFVMSSRSDEWPLALVEAAMSGLPIVATDVCGSIVEIVRPYYSGLIVPPEDSESLASALVECHNVPLSIWGQRARQHALAFTTDCWADRWDRAFKTCLSGN